MGFLLDFLDSHTSTDWNGDGKIDSWDDVLEAAMLTQMLDDDAREERIRKIVDAIVRGDPAEPRPLPYRKRGI